ncbi:serine/threonine protein kinase [Corallococcus exercitus]|uniref:non-specific serine/threonine protein kinase n=2 Tax=Corallococcus exercitus TaxID=2316736 RepID=A0A7Y4KQA5_9BACT|nr:serine/threonine protein kinase [Corallococcus exercitus]
MESQTSNASITSLRVGSLTHVRVAGVIDETFPLTPASKGLQGLVVVDLGLVERISSFGVRRWIEFAGHPPQGVSGLYVVNAPPVVVDQLNMVEGFAGVARVLSLLAPYTCRFCKEDRLRLVRLVEEGKVLDQGGAPPHHCPVCAQPLEFADEPTEFFDFARRQQFSAVDPAVLRYLRAGLPSEPSELSSHLKIVQDDITFITLASTLKGDLNVRRLASGLEGRVAFDCCHVSTVEPEALPRIEQVLEVASQGAQVVLCRVPPPMLGVLAKSTKALPAKLATLWLPCDCRNCGQVTHHRIQTSEYLEVLRAKGTMDRVCPVCGGSARAPALAQFQGLLARTPLTDKPLDDIEALEQRALSQYLFGSTNQDPGAKGTSATDTHNSGARLQIIRRLGQGGMAEVFLAKQQGVKGFEKFVVMKKILAQFAENPEFVDMLFAEARANARLTHPNIVQTFDVGVTDGVAYILMEYVRGPDLKRLLTELRRKGMALPLEHALRIVAEVAAGLHYAHSYVDPSGTAHPVVHRDVSPHNVLVSLDGAIKLSDFGIAKVQGEEQTQAGVIKGKISYLSPEAASGRPLDWRNDVFALGVVLFELLTGQLPFRRDHDAATLAAIVREPAPVPSQLRPHIPQDVSDLILRALVKDPARRTPTAAAMREEIEAVITHHRLSSSPASVAQFFKEALGDRLSEYAPSSIAGSGTGSNPRALMPGTGSHSRNLGTGSSSDMRAPSDLSRPPVRGGSGSMPRMEPPPVASPPEAAERGTEVVSVTSDPPRPPVAAPPVAPPVAAAPRPSRPAAPPPVSPLPPPTAVRPAASANVPTRVGPPPQRPSVSVPSVAPLTTAPPPPPVSAVPPAPVAAHPQHGGTHAQYGVAPTPQASAHPPQSGTHAAHGGNPPAPPPPVAAPPPPPQVSTPARPPAAPVAAPPAPIHAVAPAAAVPAADATGKGLTSGQRKGLVVGGVGLVLAGLALVFLLPKGGVEVRNAQEGERVYVSGVLLEGSNALPEDPSGWLVSTAVEGKLHRFGKVPKSEHIDLRTLADAAPQADARGTLSVTGAQGCRVALGSQVLQGQTPLSSPMPAGREFEVRVTCGGKPDVVRWVMAMPGQGVALDVP